MDGVPSLLVALSLSLLSTRKEEKEEEKLWWLMSFQVIFKSKMEEEMESSQVSLFLSKFWLAQGGRERMNSQV